MMLSANLASFQGNHELSDRSSNWSAERWCRGVLDESNEASAALFQMQRAASKMAHTNELARIALGRMELP
jgi:hypothetical protein